MNYLGDFAEDATVRILFTTAAAAGGAVAPSSAFEADDIRIYKNNGATQKATTNGITMTSPFDSVTGLHALDIDTSNDTGDSGFWTSGAEYSVVAVPDETVDSQTVVSVIATFSIENRHANLRSILGTRLTESSAGYLAAGFKKLLDVASPVFTLASVNQTGDAYVQTNQLVNGSAWVEMFGPRQVAIPQSGSRTHRILFTVRNGRGHLTSATSLSVVTATDLGGNNVAANCSVFTTVLTGVYYLDYTVASTHAETIVRVFVSGVASSSALYFECGFAVGRFDVADELSLYDPPTNTELEARTLAAADYATETSQTTILNRLGAWTGSGINTVLGAFRALMTKAAGLTPTDISTGTTYDNTADSLEAIRDRGDAAWTTGGGGGGITGDHTITVTVLDASTSEPIENARVRIYRTGADGTSETGADGVAVLGRDSATWTVVVSASGYETLVSELVVSDDASVTYQLTPLVVVPGTGELTTGYLTALDDEGQPEDGVVIYCEMTAAPSGDTGFAYDTRQRAETSGLNGLVQFSGLVKGGTYRIWRGVRTPQATLVTIPADAASTYQLPSRIGREVT